MDLHHINQKDSDGLVLFGPPPIENNHTPSFDLGNLVGEIKELITIYVNKEEDWHMVD